MITVLSGADRVRSRAKAASLRAALMLKNPAASVFSLSEEAIANGWLAELTQGRTLFAPRHIVLADNLLAKIPDRAALADSDHVFLFTEDALDPALAEEVKKLGGKVQAFDLSRAAPKDAFNVFWVANALAARDRQKAWVMYERGRLAGIAAEELFFPLAWKVRQMLSKKQFGRYAREELVALSHAFVALYHDARRGLADFELGLEKIILTL